MIDLQNKYERRVSKLFSILSDFPPYEKFAGQFLHRRWSLAGLFLAGSFIHWAFNKFETSLCKDLSRYGQNASQCPSVSTTPIMAMGCQRCLPRNVCSTEKYTKRSSVLLLRLVYFSLEQMLVLSSWKVNIVENPIAKMGL